MKGRVSEEDAGFFCDPDGARRPRAEHCLVEPDLQKFITDADLLKTFEVLYGPKVQCRMIVYKEINQATKAWQRIRDGKSVEAAFIEEAKAFR